MRKATIFLMALALTLILPGVVVQQQTTVAATPSPLRRSRFLANFSFNANLYACTKKNEASICMAAGSPGSSCCNGSCVDTDYSSQHCGNCNKKCRYTWACCQGECVNIFTDENNCGGCGVKCRTCTNGVCDYAA